MLESEIASRSSECELAKNTKFHESTGEQYIENQQLMAKHQECVIGELETYR